MTLKIESIDIYKINIPMKFPFKIALGTSYEANNVWVRINSNKDIYGWGEGCSSLTVTGTTQSNSFDAGILIAKNLKGKDPLALNSRMYDIDKTIVGHSQIKSAFNQALYDILGKFTNLPLYSLLGGENHRILTDYTLGIQDSVDIAIEKAQQIIDWGFQAIKVKVGLNKDFDIDLIKKIRNLSNNISIRIDANQGWNLSTAIEVLNKIEPYNLQYAEQPLPYWDIFNMKRLREKIKIPICADESVFDHHDAFKLTSLGACDILNIKLGKSKGITTALKINSIAESCGLKCMLGCFNESRLGLSFGAHLASALNNIAYVDLDSALMHKEDYVIGGIKYENGDIIIPGTPGHGADVKADFLEKLEKATI
ncbi:MAG: mandelate racemase/muconate lactonizing enzyme family protein [Promethearchaeota archaeon]